MTDIPAPISFPPNLNAQPINAFANNLRQVSAGLAQQSNSLADVTGLTLSCWSGQGSNAFATNITRRASELATASQAIASAPDALIQYAETIRWAQSAHADTMRTYYAAWNQLPESEPVLRQCVVLQQEVIDTADIAAQRCATILRNVRNQFDHLLVLYPSQMPTPVPMPNAEALPNPGSAGQTPTPFDYQGLVSNTKYTFKGGLWVAETFEIYLHNRQHQIEHLIKTHGRNGGLPFTRGTQSVLAWKPGANLTATHGTLAQTTARLNRLSGTISSMKVWLRGASVVGSALSGGVQVAEDWDRNLSTGQRTARAVTATVLEGGGAWGGFAAGAALGGAIGTGFFGVGAIPGAIIGGVVGVAGAFLGGWIGKTAKEAAFEHGPEEVFGGN
jgi:hypothetical protein